MAELVSALGIAILVGWGIYVLIESFEIFSADRKGPKHPISGVESAVGRSAKVIGNFSATTQNPASGRIQYEGEDWNAIYVGDSGDPPVAGETVTIVEIDAAKLKAFVR